jgi:hypothetical protein
MDVVESFSCLCKEDSRPPGVRRSHELDAYELLSKVAKIHFTEMVDPNYIEVASIEKKYLPARK